MELVKLDIDIESPYLLAKELFTLANHDCRIRVSATKGVHLIIEGLSPSQAFSIRNRLDDPHRMKLDEDRKRGNPNATINVLWDKKDGKESGVWLHWRTHSLAFWLLQDTGRTLRNCIINLHNVMMVYEFQECDMLLVQERCKHLWFQKNQYERVCENCGLKEDWTI